MSSDTTPRNLLPGRGLCIAIDRALRVAAVKQVPLYVWATYSRLCIEQTPPPFRAHHWRVDPSGAVYYVPSHTAQHLDGERITQLTPDQYTEEGASCTRST